VIEKIADAQHKIWSHWMDYLFSTCEERNDGCVVIPKDKVDRWKRQIKTQYIDLSESEKDSDIKIAFDVLKVVQKEID